jgi:hypothetical protein
MFAQVVLQLLAPLSQVFIFFLQHHKLLHFGSELGIVSC